MKFDLELENEVGAVSITLNKDFCEGEVEEIVSFAKSLLQKKYSREETTSWSKENTSEEPENGVFAWKDSSGYYELVFGEVKNKISAIAAIRGALGCGLKEAVDMIENKTRVPPLSPFNANVVKESLEKVGVNEFTLNLV